jgi:transposase
MPLEKASGHPRKYPSREVMNGLPSVLRDGCGWRLMPHDLPPWQTADQDVRAWRHDGTWQRIPAPLRERVRTQIGRPPPPSVVWNAQPGKATEPGAAWLCWHQQSQQLQAPSPR